MLVYCLYSAMSKVQRQLLNYAENSRKKRRSKRLLCEFVLILLPF